MTVTSASDFDRSSGNDSLLGWMRERQKAFKDFEQSFHGSGIGSGGGISNNKSNIFPDFQSLLLLAIRLIIQAFLTTHHQGQRQK